nr:immunoglobulin heavy chain junction region [Macaca mulatta]MOW45799.1 immunoglobulin heavy chain junction region [Macaca mulatta]MOW45849.1 immunoglobulin heavy chain junction region [Macaca mulatta]MOW45907.1 immunoglobulin heavy chain junction region [Macaca mulatta]MOW46267.1 immunoglobulin heavy chain junction region [Macaca mulatta]
CAGHKLEYCSGIYCYVTYGLDFW